MVPKKVPAGRPPLSWRSQGDSARPPALPDPAGTAAGNARARPSSRSAVSAPGMALGVTGTMGWGHWWHREWPGHAATAPGWLLWPRWPRHGRFGLVCVQFQVFPPRSGPCRCFWGSQTQPFPRPQPREPLSSPNPRGSRRESAAPLDFLWKSQFWTLRGARGRLLPPGSSREGLRGIPSLAAFPRD